MILHRRYEVRALQQSPVDTLLIAVGYADLYFARISASPLGPDPLAGSRGPRRGGAARRSRSADLRLPPAQRRSGRMTP